MGRLNAALNVLAQRGEFALGPTPSEKVQPAPDDAKDEVEEGTVAEVPADQAADSPAEVATETVRPMDTPKAETPGGTNPSAANQDAHDGKPEDSEAAASSKITMENPYPPSSESVLAVEEKADYGSNVTQGVEPEPDVESADVDEALLDRGDNSSLKVAEAEVDFKVPSHLFDTGTADMDELRAQLGVLTHAEREARIRQTEAEPVEKEILLPIVPQPLEVRAEDVPPAGPAETDERQTGSAASPGPDAIQPVDQQFEVDELGAETLPNSRFVRPPADPETAVTERQIDQPQPEAESAEDPPSESAYRPVLGTWFDLPQPAGAGGRAQLDDLQVQRSAEQAGPRASSSSPIVESEVAPVDQSVNTALPAAGMSRTSGSRVAEISCTTPTEFEISMAERLLQTEFGVRIQQLSEQVSSQLSIGEPQVVLLASMKPDPQRAEAVAGLGMFICAQQILPTLVVDADVQEKQVTRLFAKHGPGLLECIGGQLIWDDVIRGTSCEKLHVMPCGTSLGITGNYDQTTLPALIEQWKQRYSLVIIDGGLADSPLTSALAQRADATFLCVQLGTTNREELLTASEHLTQAGARLKGCITTAPIS